MKSPVKKVLGIIDWIAMAVVMLSLVLVIGSSAMFAIIVTLIEMAEQIGRISRDPGVRGLLLAGLVSIIWCALRWKQLNSSD
jgi:hypothetical protein